MPQSDDDFRSKLDAARVWEKKLARWVRRRGWYVVPTYDFSGKGEDKAPKLLAPLGKESLVLPDLQCFRAGEQQWLECKYKSEAIVYRKGGYRTTGISRRLRDHYEQVQQATGASVVIAFLHEKEREVRGAALVDLAQHFSHEYAGAKMGRSGMVFWKYDELPCWGRLEAIRAEEAA